MDEESNSQNDEVIPLGEKEKDLEEESDLMQSTNGEFELNWYLYKYFLI